MALSWIKEASYNKRLLIIICIISCAILLPRIFLIASDFIKKYRETATKSSYFKLGLENISDKFLKKITNNFTYKVGLITTETAVDQKGRRNVDILINKKVNIVKLLMPDIHLNDQQNFYRCNQYTIPIHPFYVSNELHVINKEACSSVDLFIFDIQDLGAHCNNYVYTLLDALKISIETNKPIVILDRPNALGYTMEGILEGIPDRSSIPLHYGMTFAELAHYFNKHLLSENADLFIVPMLNYNRTSPVHLSCNRSSKSCYGRLFLDLLAEIRPFDIGLGTQYAYQCIALPEAMMINKQKWYELRSLLNEQGINGTFVKYFNDQNNQMYHGLQIAIDNTTTFSSIKTLITVLFFFKKLGVHLQFSNAFDTIMGNTKIKDYIEGRIDYHLLVSNSNNELKLFFNKAINSFIYKPFPKLVMV